MMQLGPFPSINCSLQAELMAVARDDTSVLKQAGTIEETTKCAVAGGYYRRAAIHYT